MKDYNSLITDKNGKPIKIGILAAHHCIRCIRIAESLKSVGYEVYGNGNKDAFGINVYDSYFLWKNEQQFKQSVKMLIDAGCSILEWNNEPDHPMDWAREVINSMGKQKEVKLVYNAHDLDNIRLGYIPIPERQAFNHADAVIYVSESIKKRCNKLHKRNVPSIVLYNYPTKKMVDNVEIDWDKISNKKKNMVYEGGVNPIGDSDDVRQMNQVFKYRNLFPIFKKLVELGNEVHVIPGNIDAYYTGQHVGAMVYPPMEFNKLLQKLTEFKYNLLIFNNEDGKQDQVNYTTPNKLWDGLCAGLPSIACWCPETEKYVKRHGIGWTFNNLEEISDCSSLEDQYMDVIKNVKVKRNELVFERQIVLLENLYAHLLGVEKKGLPDDIKQQVIFEYGKKNIAKLIN